MRIAIAAVIVIVVVAGCDFRVPPTVGECSESNGTCVCLLPEGVCVECTVDDERNCVGTTPQCGDDNRCRACRANDDCPSSACLEDGACADPNRVIYAAPNGVNTTGCGLAASQNECSITQALAEVNPPRDIIRLAAGMYTVTGVNGLDFNTRSATLVARGAAIRNLDGAIMSATNNRTLKVIGGTLLGPNNNDGLRCSSGGTLLVHETTIERMTQSGIEGDSCELTVSRATIRNNPEGGILMLNTPRVAKITNNFVYLNGSLTSTVGGMSLKLAPGSALEFNTVVSNLASGVDGRAGGIFCEATNSYEPPYNIVYRNQGGLDGMVQVIGTCVFLPTKSYVLGTPDPSENMVGFEDPNKLTNPSFRLTASSPEMVVRDAFDCRDVFDFEGDPRPAPEGGKCDYGADEFRPGQ